MLTKDAVTTEHLMPHSSTLIGATRIALELRSSFGTNRSSGRAIERFWCHFFLRIPTGFRLLHRFVTPAALFECISDKVRQQLLGGFLSVEQVRTSERTR